jgi:gamma-glutamyltranspeptidase/glutathione hydrolase
MAKYHSQWLPDLLYYEKGRSDSLLLDSLENLGHEMYEYPLIGKMKVIRVQNGILEAAGDTLRGDDKAMLN